MEIDIHATGQVSPYGSDEIDEIIINCFQSSYAEIGQLVQDSVSSVNPKDITEDINSNTIFILSGVGVVAALLVSILVLGILYKRRSNGASIKLSSSSKIFDKFQVINDSFELKMKTFNTNEEKEEKSKIPQQHRRKKQKHEVTSKEIAVIKQFNYDVEEDICDIDINSEYSTVSSVTDNNQYFARDCANTRENEVVEEVDTGLNCNNKPWMFCGDLNQAMSSPHSACLNKKSTNEKNKKSTNEINKKSTSEINKKLTNEYHCGCLEQYDGNTFQPRSTLLSKFQREESYQDTILDSDSSALYMDLNIPYQAAREARNISNVFAKSARARSENNDRGSKGNRLESP